MNNINQNKASSTLIYAMLCSGKYVDGCSKVNPSALITCASPAGLKASVQELANNPGNKKFRIIDISSALPMSQQQIIRACAMESGLWEADELPAIGEYTEEWVKNTFISKALETNPKLVHQCCKLTIAYCKQEPKLSSMLNVLSDFAMSAQNVVIRKHNEEVLSSVQAQEEVDAQEDELLAYMRENAMA